MHIVVKKLCGGFRVENYNFGENSPYNNSYGFNNYYPGYSLPGYPTRCIPTYEFPYTMACYPGFMSNLFPVNGCYYPFDFGLSAWNYSIIEPNSSSLVQSSHIILIRIPIRFPQQIISGCFAAEINATPKEGENFIGLYDSRLNLIAESDDITELLSDIKIIKADFNRPVIAKDREVYFAVLLNYESPGSIYEFGIQPLNIEGIDEMANGKAFAYTTTAGTYKSLPSKLNSNDIIKRQSIPWVGIV